EFALAAVSVDDRRNNPCPPTLGRLERPNDGSQLVVDADLRQRQGERRLRARDLTEGKTQQCSGEDKPRPVRKGLESDHGASLQADYRSRHVLSQIVVDKSPGAQTSNGRLLGGRIHVTAARS